MLAHPFQYRLEESALRELIESAVKAGLLGLECRYSLYDAEQTGTLLALSEEYGLLPTGGSDFHGTVKPHIALGAGRGDLAVPYAWLEGIKKLRGI